MGKKKLVYLESLRGIAAISVALFHFRTNGHLDNPFTTNAWLLVDFFFVLSGFVIALNYTDRLSTFSQVLGFQWRRFLRLYPLHLVMLAIFLGIEYAKYLAKIQGGLEADVPLTTADEAFAVAANLFMIHAWVLSELTYNYPSWSISAEFYTYAIFAAAIYLTRGRKNLLFPILSITIVALYLLLKSTGLHTDNISGPTRCLYSFAIGVVVFHVFQLIEHRLRLGSSAPGIALLVLCVLSVIRLGDHTSSLDTLVPGLFGISVLVLNLTGEQTSLIQLLSRRWLVYLGTISYGIYMIHAVVWRGIGKALRAIFHLPTGLNDEGKIAVLLPNPFIADALTIGGLAAIILLAHLSYQHIERRFVAIGQKS